MSFGYSGYKGTQMLVYLMKEHGIKKVIISPGATHISLIGSLQHDSYFELYSAVDERGAAYMACGLACESGEPVAVACTGSTASRNYLSGLAEAFNRKLPILAITGMHDTCNGGNLFPQFVDRSQQPKDTVRLSVHIQEIKDTQDEWECNLKINRALLELRRHGGGPVHINLTSVNKFGLKETELSRTRVIRRYYRGQELPELSASGKIAVSVGAHQLWDKQLTEAVDGFCGKYDAVVLVDHSSGYHGKYRVLPTLVASQEMYKSPIFDIDLLIHIGEQTGDYYTYYQLMNTKRVWRVSEDGELRDTFHKLNTVFEMSEIDFFKYYADEVDLNMNGYLHACQDEITSVEEKVPEVPLSNIWLSKEIAHRIPPNSSVHFGVSNTMRSWTFFELPGSVTSIANVGMRGIDGALSTAVGMSLTDKNKIQYCILGDLTFFYDLNVLGNRHIGNNLRILLVNNGMGAEFSLYSHPGCLQMGESAGMYVAAKDHNGGKSKRLVRHYAEDLGFMYLSAETKEEVRRQLETFLSPEIGEKPIIFEVFTDPDEESNALKQIRNIKNGTFTKIAVQAKYKMKSVLSPKGARIVKGLIGKR